MFLPLILSTAASLPSPYVQFTQTDVSGSTVYCSLDSLTYLPDSTLVVSASLCIKDGVFSDGFEGVQGSGETVGDDGGPVGDRTR